jgi:GDP-D-mannose dehydratase
MRFTVYCPSRFHFQHGRLGGIYSDPHESGVRLYLLYGDVTDASGLRHILEKVQPDDLQAGDKPSATEPSRRKGCF